MKQNGSALPTGSGSVDTATLGLPGFVVLAAGEYGGELELLIETTEHRHITLCMVALAFLVTVTATDDARPPNEPFGPRPFLPDPRNPIGLTVAEARLLATFLGRSATRPTFGAGHTGDDSTRPPRATTTTEPDSQILQVSKPAGPGGTVHAGVGDRP